MISFHPGMVARFSKYQPTLPARWIGWSPSNFQFQISILIRFQFQFPISIEPTLAARWIGWSPSESQAVKGGLLSSRRLRSSCFFTHHICVWLVWKDKRRKTKTLFPKLAAMWRAVRPLESGKSTLSAQNWSRIKKDFFQKKIPNWPRIDARKIVSKKNLAPAAMRRVAAFLSPSATAVWRRDPPCPPYWQFTASLGDQSFLRFCDLI